MSRSPMNWTISWKERREEFKRRRKRYSRRVVYRPPPFPYWYGNCIFLAAALLFNRLCVIDNGDLDLLTHDPALTYRQTPLTKEMRRKKYLILPSYFLIPPVQLALFLLLPSLLQSPQKVGGLQQHQQQNNKDEFGTSLFFCSAVIPLLLEQPVPPIYTWLYSSYDDDVCV